ncbi:cytochrome c3 family protein [Ferrimonas aestuarii]|uniref:Cytochrome C n=1 Tax=Ferrimonas aestuarii TaxID=2569539 RepID=A0A4V6WMT0_9GAMM|nr:cytochrome c3 family protein [Ferrimonas aestuarii]TKB56036.1 cytochrome C [Ferrimonas aestuarii]
MKAQLVGLALALMSAQFAHAGDLVPIKGNIEGRTNHQFLYEDGCKGCHSGSARKLVDDSACVECHGDINSIEITTELVLEEANPHNSIHYNKGASCLACHSEHEKSAPLCTDCHRTWFNER